jgi:hypothetical protein
MSSLPSRLDLDRTKICTLVELRSLITISGMHSRHPAFSQCKSGLRRNTGFTDGSRAVEIITGILLLSPARLPQTITAT